MIIVWGIAILALAIFLFSSIAKGQNVLKTNKFLSSLSDDDLYNTFNFEIKDLEDLSIKLISESLEILKTDEENISVELYGSWHKAIEPEFSCKNNMLIIEQNVKNALYNRLVRVKVPSSIISKNTNFNASIVSGLCNIDDFDINRLNVSNVSGLIIIKNVVCNETNTNNVSGISRIEQCKINQITADSVSGSIYLDGSFESVNANAVSGGISVSNNIDFTKDCNFNVTSGSISISLPENSNANLNCASFSGRVSNEFTGSKDKALNEKLGNGSYTLHAKSVSGSISINKKI